MMLPQNYNVAFKEQLGKSVILTSELG